jgi:type I restriction enzyme, S subunit
MKAGWEIKKLGELCDFEGGSQPPKSEFIYDEKPGYVRFLQIRDFGSDKKITYIYQSKKNRLCNKSDIMIGRYGASVGKILTGKTGAYNVALMKTIPNLEVLDRSWFHKYLISDEFQKPLLNVADRSAQSGFSKDDIYNFSIPVPPLPEQQRIVTILDEAFDGIATAKANAEKNLQNARALFESHLQSVFTQRGEGWVEKTFEEVCHKITDGTHHSPQTQFSERTPGRFPYITSKNIRNNYMDLSKVAYIERAFHDEVYARCQPCLGDVLLTKDGANTGNVTLNTIDEPFSLLSSVCLIKTNHSLLKPAFLCFFIQSSVGLSSIVGQMTGAAIKRIVLRDIKKAVIPFPPLKEQDSIVTTLNLLHEETQRLESIYQQKLAAFEALKKSLLDQAFTGQL